MAKQESFIKLRGKLGDLSFYKDRNTGYQARMKGGVDGARIKSDPNFQRTRENMAEFGRAATTGKVLRDQLNNVLFSVKDTSMPNRLASLVHRIQKADPESVRGERKLLPENAGLLRGFEFNKGSKLSTVFNRELTPAFDGLEQLATLDIPEFNPLTDVAVLPDATHIQFVLAVAELDLVSDFPKRAAVVHSEYISLREVYAGDELETTLDLTHLESTVYMLVGISVFQEVNGEYYPLNNGQYNALSIAGVEIF